MPEEDTIAAISTPAGEGGIGIVRVSGTKAFDLVDQIFIPHRGKKKEYPLSHHLYHGHIVNEKGEVIDEVLVSFMRSPHTYTCEDTVEVNCHSGIVTLRLILRLILKKGARLAEPGEFTRRAFLNGRIDLSQAESVLRLIQARSEEGVKLAALNVKGYLANEIVSLRNSIMDNLAQVETSLDFPEDLEDDSIMEAQLKSNLEKIINQLKDLLEGADRGRAYQEGIKTAIIGKPNVGKSSLLNALLKQQRAIVHEMPGTTRDLLEGYIHLGGYPIRIIDTAGIRQTVDPVEQEGINRSKNAAEEAQLLLIVLDGSTPWEAEDEAITRLIREDQAVLMVLNKTDLPPRTTLNEVQERLPGIPVVSTAIVKNEGIRQLEEEMIKLLDLKLGHGGENTALLSLRQEEAIKGALHHLEKAVEQLDTYPLELASLELHNAWKKLGEITGDTVSDELLDRIFSQFCIGK